MQEAKTRKNTRPCSSQHVMYEDFIFTRPNWYSNRLHFGTRERERERGRFHNRIEIKRKIHSSAFRASEMQSIERIKLKILSFSSEFHCCCFCLALTAFGCYHLRSICLSLMLMRFHSHKTAAARERGTPCIYDWCNFAFIFALSLAYRECIKRNHWSRWRQRKKRTPHIFFIHIYVDVLFSFFMIYRDHQDILDFNEKKAVESIKWSSKPSKCFGR